MTGGHSIAGRVLTRLAPAITLLLAAALFKLLAPGTPFGFSDARLILAQSVAVGLAGVGMTLIIMSGGIDLSVASVVALASVVAARVTEGWRPGEGGALPYLAILAAVAVGTACGLYSGVLIVLLRLPRFIVTPGMLRLHRGLAKWAAGNAQVIGHAGPVGDWVLASPPARLAWSADAPSVWKTLLPPSVWVLLIASAAMAWLIQFTILGRRAVAIGSNEEAARRAAVPIRNVKVLVYTISGALVGLAGAWYYARLGGSGDPTCAPGLELNAIAAVVIGGASLSGGTGSVAGTLCGALLMALLDNRGVALGWPNYAQELVVGNIIILAVAFDRWRAARMAR